MSHQFTIDDFLDISDDGVGLTEKQREAASRGVKAETPVLRTSASEFGYSKEQASTLSISAMLQGVPQYMDQRTSLRQQDFALSRIAAARVAAEGTPGLGYEEIIPRSVLAEATTIDVSEFSGLDLGLGGLLDGSSDGYGDEYFGVDDGWLGEIQPRSAWGADPPRSVSSISPTSELILHHTAGERRPIPGQIKSVQEFHMNGRNWNDIAYNFLVTVDGQKWEGRGGLVAGGHTKGHNTSAHAVCAVGNFNNLTPTGALVNGLAYVAAFGYVQGWWTTKGYTGGHRDYGSTACPGDKLYAVMDTINRKAEELIPTIRKENIYSGFRGGIGAGAGGGGTPMGSTALATQSNTGAYEGGTISSATIGSWWGPVCGGPLADFTLHGGVKVQVRPGILEAIEWMNRAFVKYNYKVTDPWGGAYACRKMTSNKSKWSVHAYGVAIDINPRANPYSTNFQTDMPAGMVKDIKGIRTKGGKPVWRWGGDWTGTKDTMHFDIIVSPRDMASGLDPRTRP